MHDPGLFLSVIANMKEKEKAGLDPDTEPSLGSVQPKIKLLASGLLLLKGSVMLKPQGAQNIKVIHHRMKKDEGETLHIRIKVSRNSDISSLTVHVS